MLRWLPVEVVVPLPIRESELLGFTPQEWAMLDDGGLVTYDMPPDQVGEVFAVKRKHGCLSANDCFCIVATSYISNSILLTGDKILSRVAQERSLEVHGVLWVVEQLHRLGLCEHELLRSALTIWRNEKSVFVPNYRIDAQLRTLERVFQ